MMESVVPYPLYTLFVWIHILAAMIWIGGMAFLALVVIPSLRHPKLSPVRDHAIQQIGFRFRVIGWGALTALFLTGILNLWARGYTLNDLMTGRLWQGMFGRTLAEKLTLFGMILLISALHDFWVGPKAVAATLQGNPGGRGWWKASSWLGRINLLLGLLTVLLGILLVRGRIF